MVLSQRLVISDVSLTLSRYRSLQAKIAVACKAIRVFYVVLQTGCDFDEEKFRKDIIHPEAA